MGTNKYDVADLDPISKSQASEVARKYNGIKKEADLGAEKGRIYVVTLQPMGELLVQRSLTGPG